MPDARPGPIDTLLVCGFLGGGKTTRINQLIREGQLPGALFLVNDFGRLNIDAEWIDTQEDGVLRLNNGCACCGISGNLSAQLTEIRQWSSPPERLVLEASGVARPRPLMQLFEAAPGYRLARVETLVDLSAIDRLLDDAAISDIVHDQLQNVDDLLVNRHAAISSGAMADALSRISAINPRARLSMLPDVQPAPQSQARQCPAAAWPDFSALAAPGATLSSRTLYLADPLDIERLGSLFDAARPVLLRVKGMLRSRSAPGDRLALQWTTSGMRLTPLPDARQEALVLIGKGEQGLDLLVRLISVTARESIGCVDPQH